MRYVQLLASVAYIIFLPVLLVTTNVRILAGDTWFMERGFRDHDAEEATGVPLYELDRSAQAIVDYFENDANDLRIVVLEADREAPLFSEREIDHMRDVKSLIRLIFRLNEIALAVVIIYVGAVVLWSREKHLRRLAVESLYGIGVALAALVAIGGFALVGFDEFWNTFHEVLFRNDLWQLDPDTDRLLQMFPEAFWQEMSYIFAVVTAIEAMAIVFLSMGYLAYSGRTVEEGPEPARARRLRRR